MSFATGMEGAAMLLPWFRHDVERGLVVVSVKPRWFQWGYLTTHGEKTHWYILIRLPSYVMQVAWHRYDGPPTWHQRTLMFKEKVVGGDGTWTMNEWECEEHQCKS